MGDCDTPERYRQYGSGHGRTSSAIFKEMSSQNSCFNDRHANERIPPSGCRNRITSGELACTNMDIQYLLEVCYGICAVTRDFFAQSLSVSAVVWTAASIRHELPPTNHSSHPQFRSLKHDRHVRSVVTAKKRGKTRSVTPLSIRRRRSSCLGHRDLFCKCVRAYDDLEAELSFCRFRLNFKVSSKRSDTAPLPQPPRRFQILSAVQRYRVRVAEIASQHFVRNQSFDGQQT